MIVQYTVSVALNGRDAARQRAVLATLPNDFRVVDGAADIVLLSGHADGLAGTWADALLRIGAGTRAIMLTSPAGLDSAQRAALAQIEVERGIPVVIARNYAPWFEQDRAAFDPEIAADVAILDLTAMVGAGGGMADAMLELLYIAELVAGPLDAARFLVDTADVFVIEISGGKLPSPARLSAYRGLTERLEFDRVARGRRERIEIAHDAHGRPALIGHHDVSGSHFATPVYQGGYRAGWLALHKAMTGPGAAPGGGLARLEANCALISR